MELESMQTSKIFQVCVREPYLSPSVHLDPSGLLERVGSACRGALGREGEGGLVSPRCRSDAS